MTLIDVTTVVTCKMTKCYVLNHNVCKLQYLRYIPRFDVYFIITTCFPSVYKPRNIIVDFILTALEDIQKFQKVNVKVLVGS